MTSTWPTFRHIQGESPHSGNGDGTRRESPSLKERATGSVPDTRRVRAPAAGETDAVRNTSADTETTPDRLIGDHLLEPLDEAIGRTRDYLLSHQDSQGYWVGELEGDTILESEYLLLLAFLGREGSEEAKLAANYIRQQQLSEGGWAIYPGGPLEISASVKAYFVLKLTGDAPDAEHMVRARQAILKAGGAERVNSFTRYYLALLGILSYDQCPAVPPELILIPRWMPFNVYEMSAWSRTIVVPLSLLWAFRPVRRLPPELGIRELFLTSPEELTVSIDPSGTLDELGRTTRIDWGRLFCRLDVWLKRLERWRMRPLRRWAIRRAARWMTERFADSDGLGAIFPPIIWSVVALKSLGYDDDAPEIQAALNELRKLSIRDRGGATHDDGSTNGRGEESIRLQPCQSPVWDTAITALALREAGVSAEEPALQRAVQWLVSKEARRPGDWSRSRRFSGIRGRKPPQPGGWFFEFHNEFYPDVDDTGMVLMALARSLPGEVRSAPAASPGAKGAGGNGWTAELFWEDGNVHNTSRQTGAVVSSRNVSPQRAYRHIQSINAQLAAMRRGLHWFLAMQSSDGGWGAFDADNNRELFTRVPFADHNAMIDPSSVDLTARALEVFSALAVPKDHPAVGRAIEFVWRHQEEDGCWYGRWGVNYIYGTWQSLMGLTAIGIPPEDPRIRKAAQWLKDKQQPCGGWGESPRTYDEPRLRGRGEPTASQTAWALMGLIAAGETGSNAVDRGVRYLLETQRPDGTWEEPYFTGTGFPRVFYLKYHLYRVYFPLMALARYRRGRTS